MRRQHALAIGSVVLLAVVGPAAAARAGGGGHGGHEGHADLETIRVEDDCHPPTFNTEIVPGMVFCDPSFDGDTTASEFFADIAEDGEVGKWRFHPDHTEIDPGTDLLAVNVGGELHTFTPVAAFGDGCVPDPRLSIGEDPVAECSTFDFTQPFLHPTAVFPGGDLVVHQEQHLQRYQCLIHPWMRAEIEVDH
jgi:hypothetical protein